MTLFPKVASWIQSYSTLWDEQELYPGHLAGLATYNIDHSSLVP